MWCPALALAWRKRSRTDHPLIQQTLHPPEDPAPIATLLHQALHLYTSLLGRTQLPATKAAAQILRALACSRTPDDQDDDTLDPDPDHMDFGTEATANEVATWHADPPSLPYLSNCPPPT